MLNSVTLAGRLCANPELKQTTSGMAVVNARLAVNRRGKDDVADFFDIVAFDKTATFMAQYLDKGALVGVEGRLQSRTYQTQSGDNRHVVEVIANSVQALESKQEAERRRAASGQAPSNGTRQAPTQAQEQAPVAPVAQRVHSAPAEDVGGFEDQDDPFGD